MQRYSFQTKKSRFKPIVHALSWLAFFLVSLFTLFAAISIKISNKSTKSSEDYFFKKPADLIAVFTGDKGRIPFALKSAQKFPQTKIFITGVYSKNTVQILIKNYYKTYQLDGENLDQQNLPNIEIDYLASNTVENVISTLRYLRKHNEFKTVLIVSSDYHVMRIKHIVNSLKRESDQFEFFYYGVKSDLKQLRTYKLFLKEAYKYLKTFAFLILWDENENFCSGTISEEGLCIL